MPTNPVKKVQLVTRATSTLKAHLPYNASFFDQVSHGLANMRRIHLYGAVNQDMMAHFVNLSTYHATVSKKPIDIFINTPGGEVMQGLAIYDQIKWLQRQKIKVTVTATGMCMSMGVPIMQAADVRRSTSHTRFLLHQMSYGAVGSHDSVRDRVQESDRLVAILDGILVERSKLTLDELHRLTERKDYVLDANEALVHGLIDEIV
jgi:ATP-dependent Clp protease, protease subunit